MKSIITLCLLLVLTCGFAFSQKKRAADPCANPQTQFEMNQCAGKDYKTADAALNQVYQRLVTMLDDEERAQLKSKREIFKHFYAQGQTRNHLRCRQQTLDCLGHGASTARGGCQAGIRLSGRAAEGKRRESDKSRDAWLVALVLRCDEAGRG